MSGIISYVKRIGVWLCIVIACETIMIITMMLNKIPFAEIGYGIFISLFLLLILLAFDAMRYYRHYQKVKELEHTIMLSTDGMPENVDCQHFFRQIFLGYFSDIVQAFDTLRKNVCGDDYTSLHNPIVLSSVLPAYGMFHSIQILFL